jgi:hypothetical protein
MSRQPVYPFPGAGAAACLSVAVLISACASRPSSAPSGPVAPTTAQAKPAHGRSSALVTGGESGLGISGAETPATLKAVVAAPYVVAAPPDCAAMAREIADLDDLLGPDVDVLADPKARAALEDQAGQALGSVVRGAIPYRWVLRWMTQAGRLDRELRQAILAGAARRGFLKGVRQGMSCPPPPSAPPVAAR